MNLEHIKKEPLVAPINIGAVGVFNNDYSSSIFFSDGFEKLDTVKSVTRFDYRHKLKTGVNIISELLDLSRNVDLMIIMKGSGIPLQAVKLCSKNCRTFFWMMDIYSHFTRNIKLLENSLFCDYRTATGYGTCKLWSEKTNLPVYHIIDGSDPSLYYPTGAKKSYDISFIGGSDKERDSVYNFLKNKFKVKFFGPKYSRKFVRPNEFREICGKSKIVLNISRGHLEGYSSLRLWNLLACGSMVVTKHIPNMTERMGLENKKHIVEFKNFMELQRNLEYYLSHEDEMNQVGLNGLKFLRDNRTWTHSAKEVVDLVMDKNGEAIISNVPNLVFSEKKHTKKRLAKNLPPKKRKNKTNKNVLLPKNKRKLERPAVKKRTGVSRRVKAGWITA